MKPDMSKQYYEGYAAFKLRQDSNENPYPAKQGESTDRYDWFLGFFDARYDGWERDFELRWNERKKQTFLSE